MFAVRCAHLDRYWIYHHIFVACMVYRPLEITQEKEPSNSRGLPSIAYVVGTSLNNVPAANSFARVYIYLPRSGVADTPFRIQGYELYCVKCHVSDENCISHMCLYYMKNKKYMQLQIFRVAYYTGQKLGWCGLARISV